MKSQVIRVMVVDDHPLWRESLRAELERRDGFSVVAVAPDGGVAVDAATRFAPDVILMDLDLPAMSGVEATRAITGRLAGTRVLMVSASAEESDVLEAVKAGASGYLLKSAVADEVAEAVRKVHGGEAIFTPSLAGLVLYEFRRLGQGQSPPPLGTTETQVLKLVARGYTYGEIARKLSTSLGHVRNQMQNVLTSLQIRHADAMLAEGGSPVEEGVEPHPHRVLATVLFTDIVASTEWTLRLGDEGWRDLVESHHAIVRRELARFRGRLVDTAGDGVLATFEVPAQAIRCAQAIVRAVQDLGLQIRAGVHTGECERVGDSIRGIAVHIGARVAAEALPAEILVSSTVKELVAGSGIAFFDRGLRSLKGIPGTWHLFAVDGET